ncbi:MAG: RidA family protein [Pseudomonadota bacterium]
MNAIDQRIADCGLELPAVQPPLAALLKPTRLLGRRLVVSAQLPKLNSKVIYTGRVGDTVSLETGRAATRLCALNVLAQARAALDGDLARVEAVVQVRGYVSVTPEFSEIAQVVNGASQVILDVFGEEVGAHCRSAIGVANMPFNATAEVEAEFYLSA